jgi:hypothetical protein
MRTKLIAILAMVFTLSCCLQTQAQQSIRHYGYIGPTTDSDLSRVRSYTNFTYVDGVYGESITDLATRVRNNGMRSLIDLGRVLWCPGANNTWHLCGLEREVNYVNRWNEWVAMNGAVLNDNYVLAFSVITESVIRQIPILDVERAITLVKQTYPQIPALQAEGVQDVRQPSFQVARNADWVALASYYIHPNLNDPNSNTNLLKDCVTILKSKKQPWQRTGYTLDGFYALNHYWAGISFDNMDSIAQEWYTFASRDPEAILIGIFSWYQAPDTGGYGSKDFPQHILDKHAAIGSAIFAGRFPNYQGTFDSIDCQSMAGWAWDASQPNSPISVDIYDGAQKIATVRANQFRQDLLNAGIGNGQHGFTFPIPTSLRNYYSHWITVKYSGLAEQLANNPRIISCAPLAASIAWIQPAETSWGPPNTMTVAGYAQGGSGGVQLVWRDVTINGPWNVVSWQPAPAADTTWSNTIPSSERCHSFEAYVNYSGIQSSIFLYDGVNSGYCP